MLIIKKRICYQMDFAISTDHGVEMKESEKTEKYLDFARELKKTQLIMKVMVIPICGWCM